MSDSILFLWNYLQVYEEVVEVKREYDNIELLKCDPELVLTNILPQIKKISPRAIIAMPITGNLISSKIDIPVIILYPGSLDFLEAFIEASRFSNKISYIGHSLPFLEEYFPRLESYLGIKINKYLYEGPSQRERILNGVPEEDKEVAVVTGDFVKRSIQERGGKALIVNFGRIAVLQALSTAMQVIKSKDEEVKKSKWLQLLLDLTNDGVIGTDGYGTINVFNKNAGIYLGLLHEDVIGENIKHLDERHPIKVLLGKDEDKPQENESKICIYKDKNFLVNKSILDQKGVILTFKDESEIKKLQVAIHREAVKRGMVSGYRFEDIVGKSKNTLSIIKIAKKYAKSDMTLLITGETGVGKEIFAQSIHDYSDRKTGPFVAINCATIPENLLESELFGYVGGSFTGAKREGKRGLFELAHGGTIFLDEIGDMSLAIQARLLRVLQNKEIRQLGGDKIVPVDVRVIAATNRSLDQAIIENKFRQDLYYRISILILFIPPLRQRKEDIPELVKYFLIEKAVKYKKSVAVMDNKLLQIIMECDWPGNVRQLEGFIEKYVFLYEENDNEIYNQLLNELTVEKSKVEALEDSMDQLAIHIGSIENMEKQIISKLLKKYKISELSKVLGISRTTLWRKLKNYGFKIEQVFH